MGDERRPPRPPRSDVRFLTVYFVLFASVQVALLALHARRLVGLAQPAKRVEVNGAAPLSLTGTRERRVREW